MFVLEAESHALARGVRPLARVLGYASTQDGYRVTAPRPDGSAAARAMQQALQTRPQAWREFIAHTGQVDLHKIRP